MTGRVFLENLGCVRNLVDSETMLGDLVAAGWDVTPDPGEADVVIVNTCSFIESAADESIDTILELAALKETGRCGCLIVAGCLPERYREDIAAELPEVDIFLGTGAFDQIVAAAEGKLLQACLLPDPNAMAHRPDGAPRLHTYPHMAYVKIGEGCAGHCTYCIIPKLRGRQKSRRPEAIISEGQTLVASGVRELILVSQDSTRYGKDLNPQSGLDRLLEKLAGVSDGVWIRFLYGHPESIDMSIVRAVAAHKNVCPYFDIPIQHAADPILKKMGRRTGRDDLLNLFDGIREKIPGACLRTTVMTGFPGETDNDFDVLLDFIEKVRFDHVGVFAYSDSEDLPSHNLPGHVPRELAEARREAVMAAQVDISHEKNRARADSVVRVLIEEKRDENLYAGRTMFQAPEVDGETLVRSAELAIGEFADVRITEALEYDLVGEPA